MAAATREPALLGKTLGAAPNTWYTGNTALSWLSGYDNAQAKSLWSRLKTEVLERRERPVFTDVADTQANVADYFDYYNHERLHYSIDYQLPYHTN